jgi:hypothetical protein
MSSALTLAAAPLIDDDQADARCVTIAYRARQKDDLAGHVVQEQVDNPACQLPISRDSITKLRLVKGQCRYDVGGGRRH